MSPPLCDALLDLHNSAQMLREIAVKTSDLAGDGTTTATVLAQMIVNEGLKNVAAGANPMLLKRGIEAGRDAIIAAIREGRRQFDNLRKFVRYLLSSNYTVI